MITSMAACVACIDFDAAWQHQAITWTNAGLL